MSSQLAATPVDPTRQGRINWMRSAVREMERFCYAEVGGAEGGTEEARQAQNLLRTVIGLRRKLDTWR